MEFCPRHKILRCFLSTDFTNRFNGSGVLIPIPIKLIFKALYNYPFFTMGACTSFGIYHSILHFRLLFKVQGLKKDTYDIVPQWKRKNNRLLLKFAPALAETRPGFLCGTCTACIQNMPQAKAGASAFWIPINLILADTKKLFLNLPGLPSWT